MEITSDNILDIKERAIKLWEYCGLDAEDYYSEDYVEIIGRNGVGFPVGSSCCRKCNN